MPQNREGHTPPHNIRVPDDVWTAARTRAERDGTTLTAVIVAYLKRYGRG